MRGSYEVTPQGLLCQVKDDRRKLMVPVSLRQRVMKSCHDDPVAGHVGIHRTTELVTRNYCWRTLVKDVRAYVRSCPECQGMKSDHRKQAGLLQPIPVPTRKWEQITTDLVTDLPPSNEYTAIAVFVDRLSKMVYFGPHARKRLMPSNIPSYFLIMYSVSMVYRRL